MAMMFKDGNFDTWDSVVSQLLPQAMTTVKQTVIPVVEAALLALVGSTKGFERAAAEVGVGYDPQGIPARIVVQLEYTVPSFAVADADRDDVAKDEAFINSYITQIPSVQSYPTEIDIDEGLTIVKCIVPITSQVGRR